VDVCSRKCGGRDIVFFLFFASQRRAQRPASFARRRRLRLGIGIFVEEFEEIYQDAEYGTQSNDQAAGLITQKNN
jgi:hypothetical protein